MENYRIGGPPENGVPNKLRIPWLNSSIPDHIPKDHTTFLDHMCSLDATSSAIVARQAKIFCTVGPQCREVKTLESMIEAGMSLARINLSHGDKQDHLQTIRNIREASNNFSTRLGYNHAVAIAVDLKGPEIRTGVIKGTPSEFQLATGREVTLTADWNFEKKTNANVIYIDYNQIEYKVKINDELIVDNGEILLTVTKTSIPEKTITCKIKKGGILRGERSVLIPGVPLEFPVVTESDIAAMKFAIAEEVDFVFVSLIRDADVIREIKELPFKDEPLHRARFGEHGPGIKVIAKIENLTALNNIDDIVSVADGVVICRRSLGFDLAPEQMFLAQKAIVAKCLKYGKTAICAQHLLESMSQSTGNIAVASRTEVIDVAVCITDGCDALLLTSETSSPSTDAGTRGVIECVRTASRVCQRAETAIWPRQLLAELKQQLEPPPTDAAHAIAVCVVEKARDCRAAAVVVVTTSGRSARLVSRYRPACPVIAVTRFAHVARQLVMCRGVLPLHYTKLCHPDWLKDVDLRVNYGLEYGKKRGFLVAGDCVIVVSGWRQGTGFTNTLRIIYMPASVELEQGDAEVM